MVNISALRAFFYMDNCRRLVIFCCLSGLLMACGGRRNDAGFFRYNESSGVATLDPAFAKSQSVMWTAHQLFNTLVEVNDKLEIAPSLATRWEISNEGKTYRFFLRDDVYFHDDACFPGGKGRKMLAADIAYSLRRIMDPSTASSGAWIFNGKLSLDSGFVAVNDSVFELRLYRAFPPILGILSMQYCSIIPQEAVAMYRQQFRAHPVGTGPFRFLAWEEGQTLLLPRNEHYFEKDSAGRSLPYVKGVKVSFNDSKAAEFLLFRQQQIDFINDIDASFKDEVLQKNGELREEWVAKLQLKKHAYLNTEYIGILSDSTNPLVKSSPLRIRAVRQAMNYAFDRRKMMLYLRNSIGKPAESGFIPDGLPSFDENAVRGYRYMPDSARILLQQAGFGEGKGLPVFVLLTIPQYAELGSYIAHELNENGFNVKVDVLQKSFLLEQTAQSKALFFRGSWIADYPDAENYLGVFYSKNPAPPNYTRYNNPAYDRLYEQALLETRDSQRYALYQEMDRLLVRDAPIIPLWYDEACWLVQNQVEGFAPNSLNLLELRRVRLP